MANTSLLSKLRRHMAPILPASLRDEAAVVPVVRLSGTIGVGSPLRPALTLASVAKALDKAFAVKGAKAVALVVNSPGGAPAQSHLIYRRIRDLAKEKELPVLAYVEDVAASGGYMLACAADEIVADPFSIIGSIGVVSAGFGFDRALDKLGVDRRVYTAGERKVMLDPFQPEKLEDVERLKSLQKEIHAVFTGLVRERRGDVLAGDDETLFSGEFWTAQQAQEYGLVDAIGDMRGHLRARYGDKLVTPLIQSGGGLFSRRTPGIASLGAASLATGLADELVHVADTRALWGRFGL